MSKKDFDIIIVGAGPGGCTTAMALADSDLKIGIIEAATFPRDKICGDALSGKVIDIMKKIPIEGLVAEFEKFAEKIDSWGVQFVAPNLKALDVPFTSDKSKYKIAPGYIAKRKDFDNFMFEQTKKLPNVTIFEGTKVKDVKISRQEATVTTENGKTFIADIVIGADGAQSVVTKKLTDIRVEKDHYCAGLRAYYENVSGMHKENFIELIFVKDFLPGYFWIFPLPNNQANVGVGMLSSAVSKNKVNLKERMIDIIDNHPIISKRFKNAKIVDEIKGYGLPLGSKKRRISGNRFILIGDAAYLIDPFTGEGIGNALISGLKAAEFLKSAFETNDFSKKNTKQYDDATYKRLWQELSLSRKMQKLLRFPWLFDLVVNKANKNEALQKMIMSMFEDMDLREDLKKPSFYFKLIFN
jgi:geranylgeranyl reductase family protein